MRAYHGEETIKTEILAQIAKHREADEIVKGVYWENGRGCAVGCVIHGDDHAEYETRFGIPQMLARIEDSIFEGLPNVEAKTWPGRFMGAIRHGSDLSRVGWQFLHWLLTDKMVNPGIDHPLVRDAVRQCADVLVPLTKGESAAESAWSAAESAWSAAWSARSAAWSAWSAANAESARSAWSAAESAWSAANAESARSAAGSGALGALGAYSLMSHKLIDLLEAA